MLAIIDLTTIIFIINATLNNFFLVITTIEAVLFLEYSQNNTGYHNNRVCFLSEVFSEQVSSWVDEQNVRILKN
jgi:hypothetical protein